MASEHEHGEAVPFSAPRGSMTTAAIERLEVAAADAIERVRTPEEAEALLRDVKTVAEAVRVQKLGADYERRWNRVAALALHRLGELLGKGNPGAPPGNRNAAAENNVADDHVVSQAERDIRKRARKVSAMPREKVAGHFDVEGATLAGLLRTAPDPKDRPRPRQRTETGTSLWGDEAVLAWIAKRSNAGRTRDQLVAEANAGQHGWPVDGVKLPQNAADRALAILGDRKRRGGAKPPKDSGKRLRAMRGQTGDFFNLRRAVMNAVGVLECFDLPEMKWDDDIERMVDDLYEDLERHAVWNDIAMAEMTARMGELALRRKIAKLRAREKDQRCPPSERVTAKRLADQAERKLGARLTGGA